MYRRGRLKNGLSYVLVPRPDRDVFITIGVGRGSADETGSWLGVTHFIEHLAGECWRARQQVALRLDEISGHWNAETGPDLTKWYMRLPPRNWRWGLQLMTELILNPDFTDQDFEFERLCIMEELAEIIDDPANQVLELRDNQLFSGHGLHQRIVGTHASLRGLTLERTLRYWHRLLDPRIMGVVVVGRFDPDSVLAEIRELFGHLQSPRYPVALRQLLTERPIRRVSIRRAERQQVSLQVSALLPGFGHRHRMALTLLNNCIGNMYSAPLWIAARQQGLVYSLDSSVWHYPEVGTFNVVTSTSPTKLHTLLNLIYRTLDRYYRDGVPRDLFQVARTVEFDYHSRRWRNPEYVARLLLAQLLVHQAPETSSRLRKRIAAVRWQDVNMVARRYLAPSNRYLTVIGPVTRTDRAKMRALWRSGRSR